MPGAVQLDWARARGLPDLLLATGDRQPEAVALYGGTGWERLHVDADGRSLPAWHIRFAKFVGSVSDGG